MPVFEDGTATTCPDCEGDLQYQNREAIVCLGCGVNYVHWKTTAEHQLREVEPETGESETVETAPVEDHELATDGGFEPTCALEEDGCTGDVDGQIEVTLGGTMSAKLQSCEHCAGEYGCEIDAENRGDSE